MVTFTTTIAHALLICIPFSAFAIATFLWKPRLWLHSLPPDIRQMVGEKTKAEESLTKFFLLPLVVIILPGLSIASAWYVSSTEHLDLSFLGTLIHIYGIWIIVHLWDFLIIDCGAILIIKTERIPIAGTEGAKGWSDYRFHFRAMIEAIVKSSFFVVPASFILSLLI
jgi:hypothetical protein